jgi:hypothetical protein
MIFASTYHVFTRVFVNLEAFVRLFSRYGACLCHLHRSLRRFGQLGRRRLGLRYAIVCASWAFGARVVYSARVVRTGLFINAASGLARACALPRRWPLFLFQLVTQFCQLFLTSIPVLYLIMLVRFVY